MLLFQQCQQSLSLTSMPSGVIKLNENVSYGPVGGNLSNNSTTTAAAPASMAGLASRNSALDLEDKYEEIPSVAPRPSPSVAEQIDENVNVEYLYILPSGY